MPQINIILANVEAGQLKLPEFQRGYVWNRSQVRDLFDSLYHGHPAGSLLTWLTTRDDVKIELLLDGQQRITSLYGVIKGRPPEFFHGNPRAFQSLYFHVIEEKFEFYQPIKMKSDLCWFDVTKVMQAGVDGITRIIQEQFAGTSEFQDRELRVMQSLMRLVGLAGKNFHIEQIADDKKPVNEIVDIFNRLNSAGTRLSQGDLALAKISAKWPSVREEMRKLVQEWNDHGFNFTLDWLLRCVNAVIHGESLFRHLHDTSREAFENGLQRTVKHVNNVLNQISGKLGLDHSRVLFAKYSIPVLIRHLELRKQGSIMSADEWNLMLYWFLQAGIHGRFSGTTETKIRHDLRLVDGTLSGIERLIAEIGVTWGRSQILASDFDSWSIGARTYPVLYWLTRMRGARDFCYDIELKASMMGKDSKLQVHHIFPKAKLYNAEPTKYTRPQVNALGNFCFLTARCNQWIGDKLPVQCSKDGGDGHDSDRRRIRSEGYFNWVKENNAGALESQWIPMDEELWKIEKYLDFLDARRELLAAAANKYLKDLNPSHPVTESSSQEIDKVKPVHSHITGVDEENELMDLQKWLKSSGLSQGELGYELDGNGVIIDLAWQNGLPEGTGRPVALLLNETAETYQAVSQAGYDCFIDVQSLKQYVEPN